MRACLIAPDLNSDRVARHLVAQARFFGQCGGQVQLLFSGSAAALPEDVAALRLAGSEPLPADLTIYHLVGGPPPDGLRQQVRGVVFVHDHGPGAVPGQALAAHYADLCLVSDGARRQELVAESGLPAERVVLLPEPGQVADYCTLLADVVGRALADDWPPTPGLPSEGAMTEIETNSNEPVALVPAETSLARAQSQADVMQRGYRVQSRIPLLGGLVAWLRRNLTSHLREPYLDPTLERQVAFNRTVVDWMAQVQARLEVMEAQLREVQARQAEATPWPERESDAG